MIENTYRLSTYYRIIGGFANCNLIYDSVTTDKKTEIS